MANMSVMLSIFSSSSREVEIFRVLAPGLLIGGRIREEIRYILIINLISGLKDLC